MQVLLTDRELSMKKMIFVADIFPFPMNTGGKLRTGNLLINYSKKYEIYMFCFSDVDENELDIKFAKSICKEVHLYSSKKSTLSKLINFFFGNKTNAEYLVFDKEMLKDINDFIVKNKPEIIYGERLYVFQYIKKYNNIILDMHDVEHEAISYFGRNKKRLIQRLQYKFETFKVKKLEKKALSNAKAFFVVSQRDKEMYASLMKNSVNKIHVIDNGVTFNENYSDLKSRDEDRILFVGSMKHPPNLQGIKWFVKNVWDNILLKNQNAKLQIIGSGYISEADKNELLHKNVSFLGYVEDVRPYFQKCSCLIVPLFSGSGTRLKILEAFSYKIPVVSTSIGAEGLYVSHNKNLYIADTIDDMIEYLTLCCNPQCINNEIVEASYELVKSKYNWECISKRAIEIIEKIK